MRRKGHQFALASAAVQHREVLGFAVFQSFGLDASEDRIESSGDVHPSLGSKHSHKIADPLELFELVQPPIYKLAVAAQGFGFHPE